jgi:transposase
VCGLRTRYSTDLSDPEWEILRSLVPAVRPGGRPAIHARREILNTLAYWLRAGCAGRLLPHDLPPWQTVYHYWRRRQQEGVWQRIRCRRLSKDYEYLRVCSENAIHLTMAMLLVRRLARPAR